MGKSDLIENADHTPTGQEMTGFFDPPVGILWQDFNDFLDDKYRVTAKMEFSKCSLQRGWNIKYKQAGKALCTLYPAKDHFVVLIVVGLNMLPALEARAHDFAPYIADLWRSSKAFNNTKWLMIKVDNPTVLESVKELLLFKQAYKSLGN